MTWSLFKELFLEQYFLMIIQDEKLKEFMNLILGTSTVSEYETRFTTLSRFASEMVSIGHIKCRRFEEGLQTTI